MKTGLRGKILLCCFLIGLLNDGGLSAEKPKTALVLSGGGARGFAHIGVLRALEEIGFYPDIIVGTSMGALVGGLFAAGYKAEEIENLVRNTRWNKLFSAEPYRDIEFVSQKIGALPELFTLKFDEQFNVVFPGNLLPTQRLEERIFQILISPEYASGGDFDSLMIPFRVVATDIRSGKPVVLEKGSLARSIVASSAFPIIFAPVRIDSLLLVDGGLTNNVPADVAADMGADFIIAVDVTSKTSHIPENVNLLSYFNQAMNTLAYFTDTRNLPLADILIHPEIEQYSSADFQAVDSLIRRGYAATQPFLTELRTYADSSKLAANYLPAAIRDLDSAVIRNIHIRGNQKTRPYIIRRELLLRENEHWNSTRARESLKNLYSTGLFQTAFIIFANQTADSTDIIIHVEEEENILFSFGARYDTERKAGAFVAANYRNLLGIGIDNQFSLTVSDLHRKLEWNTRSTRIFTTTLTGYSSLYHKYETVPLYENGKRIGYGNFYRNGFNFNAGVQVRRVGLTALGVKIENTRTYENTNYSLYSITNDKINTASLTARIIVENTDDPDAPRRGRRNNVLYEHGFSEDELKQTDKLLVESTVYETYSDRHTFYTNLNFGYLSRALCHYDRFRLGGPNSLPGYHQDEFWGNVMLAVGIGYRTDLTEGVYANFLIMTGNVWDGFDTFNWTDMRAGARIGVLIPTPIGPVSVDYGYDFGNRGLLYLSIGHAF
ncbi:MAG: patatin-like phospholipase family protein [Fidelibacterota bacterium]